MSGADAHKRPDKRSDGAYDPGELGHAGDVSAADTLADVANVWPAGTTDRTDQRPARQADAASEALEASKVAEAFARLRALGEAAQSVGAALGLTADELAASEAFDRVERFIPLAVERVAALDLAAARDWFAALGADLELDLTLEGLDTTFEPVSADLRAEDDPAGALARFQQAAQGVAATQGDSVSVGARLRIGKAQAQRLARQALDQRRLTLGEGAAAPELALVFYSAAACERLLTLRAAPEWERRGLGGAEARLCVALCDAAGYLAGPALEVIGVASASSASLAAADGAVKDAVGEWLPMSRAAWRRFTERAATERRLRAAESAWSGVPLTLTPDHLRVAPREPRAASAQGGQDDAERVGEVGGLGRIAARLQTLRAQVAACALASHVERSEQAGMLARFAGARPAVAQVAASGDELTDTSAQAIIALAEWAYRGASPDTLAIARQALAEMLPAGAMLTLTQLGDAAGPALDAARANLAIYLRGATERYFQLRATAQQTVNGFAEATRTAVASLTSDVTDNLFRTVGLIVGVLIAWLIQPSASLTLVKIAAALYTAYVVFIMLYLLRARQARYRMERNGLDDTLAAMSELTPTERERIRKPARAAEAHFERYYRLTRAMYLVLAVAGGLFFLLMFTPLGQAITPHVAR
jgi:hypothetical protein